jgi:hypothetical protein
VTWEDARNWCQAGKMRERVGWRLWVGGDNWATITWVELHDDVVLISTQDSTVYQVRYIDAVRCRPPGGEVGERAASPLVQRRPKPEVSYAPAMARRRFRPRDPA